MANDINQVLESNPVVPLVQADDSSVATKTSRALAAGGLTVVEVVLRTDRALDCLRAVADEVPEVIAGAGTVLSAKQAEAAFDAGAQFIVSPGLDEGVVAVARERGGPVYPGIFTPGELQRAFNLGLETVKFFPASIAGGVPALKALSSVFRTMRFMPTGGVSADNLADYLAVPAVLACGGSWLTPASAIEAGDYDQVTTLAREALQIAARS
ncbi:MAG: bifunctional 4-hydroxy-2-oxoglutarate aldolase/2-dehydro-3-deoxy-phosphogluconate aldolase [Gammaproteobacteria bacterium]|jgi:2-dehydro-3-deoxyphosphogluconate aldolase/(4S)-4-hydroxy-2-oxoglutarate aldolase|nr:bifunctional 4-hydroxy-2-oxoglutarate aldolase/2-dehydro-3-deoxy-phosphogluconate aldolase [Gammaproteobacteria bacterium]